MTRAAKSGGVRIIVMGYVIRGPLGGLTWHHLQYLMGLNALGHRVHFLEDSDDYPSCYDPTTDTTGVDPGYGLNYAAEVFARAGLGECWAFHDAHAGRWHGPRAHDMLRLCREADLLLDLSGVNPMRSWVQDIPARSLVDTDPVFTQVRHLTDADERTRACAHTAFFTFGENFGQPSCSIPDDGFPWIATRQPVVLDAWPVAPAPSGGRYTSVMQWKSYPEVEFVGVRYGMKSASFPPYRSLPSRVGPTLELAVGGPMVPRDELTAEGWAIRNPLPPTRDPWTFQKYLQDSRAEFAVAKHGYVASSSGWFSERSAGYLASGRPVIAQETGYSRWLGSTDGVLPFSDLEEACAAIADVEARYVRHCRAAREVAEAFFDAAKVLQPLIERALRPPVVPHAPAATPQAVLK